jgi:hypothetical protein
VTVRGFSLGVDWSGDGTYTGTLEDLTSGTGLGHWRLLNTLVVTSGRDLDQTDTPTVTGTLAFSLDDRDRAFSPENTASPIADLVRPGRAVRLLYTPTAVTDAFARTTANGWGTSDSGHVWTNTGGVNANYSTAGGVGVHALTATNSSRRTTVATVWPDMIATATMSVLAVATGAPLRGAVMPRGTDAANDHTRAQLNFELAGALTLSIVERIGGVDTVLDVIALSGSYGAGTRITVVAEAYRDTLRAKAYPEAGPVPDWQLTAVTRISTTTLVGLRSLSATGNSNSSPTISYDNVSVASTIELFSGRIDQLDAKPEPPATVSIRCLDTWGSLGRLPLSTPVYAGMRTGDAAHLILDAVGWPTDKRDIDPGATYMPWWWAEDTTAAQAMQDLVAAEGPPSIAFVEGAIFVFRDRHHRVLRERSTVVQATFAHADPPGSRPTALKVARGASYDHGLSRVANAVTVSVAQRRQGASAIVWSTDDAITLTDGETVQVEAQSSAPFLNAVTPVDGVDFLTSPGAVEVTLNRTSGQAVTISVKAIGGPATVLGMALRADPLTEVRTHKVAVQDAGSISTYGRQPWPNDIPFAGVHDTRAIADRIVTMYSINRPVVTVSITHVLGLPGADAYLEHALSRRIGDRVRIINDLLGLDAEFYIESIHRDVFKLGLKHTVTFGCRMAGPEQPTNVFRFDVAGAGFNDGLWGYSGVESPASIFQFDRAGHGFNDGCFAV